MHINIIGLVIEIMLEVYLFSLIVYAVWAYFLKPPEHQKAFFWNRLNLFGLILAMAALGNELDELFHEPKGNYEIRHPITPFIDSFIWTPLWCFSLIILVFCSKKRRKSVRWTFAGSALLVAIKFSHALHSYLIQHHFGSKNPVFKIYFHSFTAGWWFSASILIGLFVVVYGFYRRTDIKKFIMRLLIVP